MKIVNDKISIVQGETATHNRVVIDRETGAPFMIADGVNNPYIEFIVRPSVYTKKDDYVFKAYLDCSGIKRFKSNEILNYNEPNTDEVEWTDDITGDGDRLYRKFYQGNITYRYYDADKTYTDGTHWHPYEFRIAFTFPYADGQKGDNLIGGTSTMEAKTYKYDITLFGGAKKDNFTRGEIPIVIDYKKPLLKAADFIVEGSNSE